MVTFAVTMTALAVPAQQAAAEPEPAPAPATEGQRALAEARESGQRVEVTGERTEQTTVFANPDGFTFTLEQSTVPVRVAKPGGGWQTPDATLVKESDGTVSPKAAAVRISLSAGGDKTPLARIEDQGRSLELRWPGTLPAPQLDGPGALYAEVLPGVDLKVTATPESFQPVFVVKTPEAAANAELKKLTFGLKAEGLDVHEGSAENLIAVDGNGRTVFKAPPARMWDSAGAQAEPQTQLARTVAAATEPPAATTELSDPAEKTPSGKGLEPGQGDTVARMDVEVTKSSLSVIPDAGMLTKTDQSEFPVFIDPVVSWGESERTLLRSDGYESYGWGNGDDDEGKGAGKCGTWNSYYCGPGYVQKLYFEFSPASLKGKNVLHAAFRVTEPWAFQCSPRVVDLVRTDNISATTTWATRPKELDWMVDRNVSAGRGSLCNPDIPAKTIDFEDDPSQTWENLTPTVKNFAAGTFSRLTLELRAHDESDTSAWKRFRDDATLVVKFVAVPSPPTEVGVVSGSGYVCSTDLSAPSIVSDPTPLVQGRPRTATGGEAGAKLRIRWTVIKTLPLPPEIERVVGPTSGYVGNLVRQSRSLPTLKDGAVYQLSAKTESYYEDGSNEQTSDNSPTCFFKVDSTAPKAPQVAFGSPYTACLTNDCAAHGGPGVVGNFIFKPGGTETNVVAYRYRLSEKDAWSPDQPASAKITPRKAGKQTLYVQAKDNVGTGRYGATSVVEFMVADGEKPVSQWHFAEADGVAVDSATWDDADNATLAGSAVRDDRGRRGVLTRDTAGNPLAQPVTDKGLRLDGTTGYAATPGTVLDTSASYTVSLWARVEPGASRTLTALTQEPATGNPFSQKFIPFGLSYAGDGANTWSMAVLDSGNALRKASAQKATPRGVWTHVVGVHDATAKKISLYVNGVHQSTVDAGTLWKATGPLQIGRGVWADSFTDYFNGSLDEITVWQRALSQPEIQDEARLLTSATFAGVELAADWSAERGSGTAVADTTSGYGRSLALASGASLDREAIVLDGVGGAATTAGPVIDETGSFTATVLASLDSAKLLTKDVGYKGQILGQRTSDGSAWGFWYELKSKDTVLDPDSGKEKTVPVGIWHFGRLSADGTTFTSVQSTESAAVDDPVRMTGVYDAQDGTISLYLGAVRDGEAQEFTAQAGSGDFAVGKGYTGGKWQHFVPGRVAEVRLWAGAMAGSDQVEETVGD